MRPCLFESGLGELGAEVRGLQPLVTGVAHGIDRGIDGGLAAELEEGGMEFYNLGRISKRFCAP